MRSPLGKLLSFLSLTALGLAGATAASAQTDVEVNAAIEFDFSTPGARSLGLGGAFVALADDATAAFTNPAGLLQLTRPEVSIEGRRRVFTTTFTEGGNLGEASGLGVDSISGLVEATTSNGTNNLSFLSFVYPKKKWAIAVYRHELANMDTRFQTAGAFTDLLSFDLAEDATFIFPLRLFPVRASLDFDIESLGLSVAFRVAEKLSIGLGAYHQNLRLRSTTNRFDTGTFDSFPLYDLSDFAPGGPFGSPLFDERNIENSQIITGDDRATGYSIGLLWEPSRKVAIGVGFRFGPAFDLRIDRTLGPERTPQDPRRGTFDVPDFLTVGVALKPTQSLRLALDLTHVSYSDLTDNFTSFFDTQAAGRLSADDGEEIHLGVEYLFLTKNPVALRLGAWFDPDHRIRYEGPVTSLAGLDLLEIFDLPEEELDRIVDEQATAALFRPGDDVVHYTFGLGISIGEHVQLDAAVDLSERVDTGSLSAVFRF